MHVHVKILDELPFQGCQTLEARTPIPVLAHGLYRSLEDQGGQAEDLPVEIHPQPDGLVGPGAEIGIMALAIRGQEVVGGKLQVHAGLAYGLPLQTLVQGEAPVLIGIEGAAYVPPPVQPGAELVIVRQVHLLIGGDAGGREIEHRLVEAGKQVSLLVKDIPAAVP